MHNFSTNSTPKSLTVLAMGSAISSVMDENMKKSQKFMAESQAGMMKRQVSSQRCVRAELASFQFISHCCSD